MNSLLYPLKDQLRPFFGPFLKFGQAIMDAIELSIKYSKRILKHSVCSKLGIKWLKWGEQIVK
jgi:hypothetical protein